jgi:hypothetical protein
MLPIVTRFPVRTGARRHFGGAGFFYSNSLTGRRYNGSCKRILAECHNVGASGGVMLRRTFYDWGWISD